MEKDKLIRIGILSFLGLYLFLAILTLKSNLGTQNTQTVEVNVYNNSERSGNKIDINKCSKEALESLPNIGSKLATDIIKNRPYTDIWELDKIKGIGKETIELLKDKCEVK